MFFNDWLSRRRIYTPDRVAIVDDDRRQQHTYAELDDRASRAAGYLHGAYGIVAGDRVACLSTNRLEVVDLFFACSKLGATLVPLNYRLPPTGLTEMLEDCGPKLFVFEQQFAEFADAVFKSGIVGVHIPIEGIHDGSTKELPTELHQARNDEVAMILYTSGTTGRARER